MGARSSCRSWRLSSSRLVLPSRREKECTKMCLGRCRPCMCFCCGLLERVAKSIRSRASTCGVSTGSVFKNNKMSTQMKIVFKSVGDRVKDQVGQKPVDTEVPKATASDNPKAPMKTTFSPVKPEIKSEPLEVAMPKVAEHVHTDQCKPAETPALSSYTNVSPSEAKMVDRIPDELKDYYDWSEDVAYIHGLDDEVLQSSSSTSAPFEQAPLVQSKLDMLLILSGCLNVVCFS